MLPKWQQPRDYNLKEEALKTGHLILWHFTVDNTQSCDKM